MATMHDGFALESGDVGTPAGFKAYAAFAGIRYEGRPDMALIWSAKPAVFSGMFTTNSAEAAPVLVTREVALSGLSQAAIINSGNANAMTGAEGMDHARRMQGSLAEGLSIPPAFVAVASTGVIGVPLPMKRVLGGVEALVAQWQQGGDGDGKAAAEAILTTDTVTKALAARVQLAGGVVHIGMMAKGSGMIHPQMATMLAFFTTDAVIAKDSLDEMIHRVVDRSFHRVSVDGDPSTNDMVLCWANGLSSVAVADPPDRERFEAALTALAQAGARLIAKDGEGATRLLTVRVVGAVSEADAAQKARAAVRSSLVKSAVYGRDPNWGRVVAAVGAVGIRFDPSRVRLTMNGLTLLSDGRPWPFDERVASEAMNTDEVVFVLDLGSGQGTAEAWGCDLTERYVEINAHYRT
ncbi:MAG: bifunctional glutamate N-acetyltransferase/amino-acid acetyltransferase ArgJ [Thermaerobacter sp.]|nr:bifunctional glutamate N-acetyltransferase/amino-acid acetyltransferase ArgJ [Thermaerobacter sp.]